MRIINATAPCRINDIGGWTDTRFAGHGAVCSIAVNPGAEVQIEGKDTGGVWVYLANYGETYHRTDTGFAQKHPFIADAVERNITEESNMELTIFSRMPPGASTGTSAAVLVALIGALTKAMDCVYSKDDIAHMAHAVETELGYESGIQDQAAAAYGGISLYDIYEYPQFITYAVDISPETRNELERRLMLVYLGKPHSSSEIHKEVIDELGEGAEEDERIESLRALAPDAKVFLEDGDLCAYSSAMRISVDLQIAMNRHLVCMNAIEIMGIASRDMGVLGHKVNGAGGDGGTVTILTDGSIKNRLRLEGEISKKYQIIPVTIADEGLRVWESA